VLKEQRKTTRLRSSWKPTRTPRAPLPRPTTSMRSVDSHSRTVHPSPRVLAEAKRARSVHLRPLLPAGTPMGHASVIASNGPGRLRESTPST
jgi:hypothetical protein